LGIELAAARVRLLPPETMLAHMERRLPLLTGGPRDVPERHQTLRSAISWSYDLLNEHEQALFRRLPVFAGGCSIEAAEAVCAGSQATINALVEQSLVRRETTQSGEVRLQLLETIREFGLEQLEASGEGAEARRLHALFFVELAEAAEPKLQG